MNKVFIIFLTLLFSVSCSIKRECGYHISKTETIQSGIKNIQIDTNRIGNTIIEIPVVFHIAYRNESDKIPIEIIKQELKELNLNFQNLNSKEGLSEKFKPLVGNPNIKFKLATKDETGKTSKGIVYFKATRRNYNFRNHIFYASKIWNPKKYMNVYIGTIRKGKTKGYVNSYPWRNQKTDAIGIHHTYVGESNQLLTHEVAHWLGLWHINQGGCGDVNDGIKDTPKQSKLSVGCPENKKDCGEDCLVMNFMDYSTCRVMFTKGQVEKMHTILKQKRPGLLID